MIFKLSELHGVEIGFVCRQVDLSLLITLARTILVTLDQWHALCARRLEDRNRKVTSRSPRPCRV